MVFTYKLVRFWDSYEVLIVFRLNRTNGSDSPSSVSLCELPKLRCFLKFLDIFSMMYGQFICIVANGSLMKLYILSL